jgi:hypothetical protein
VPTETAKVSSPNFMNRSWRHLQFFMFTTP